MMKYIDYFRHPVVKLLSFHDSKHNKKIQMVADLARHEVIMADDLI